MNRATVDKIFFVIIVVGAWFMLNHFDQAKPAKSAPIVYNHGLVSVADLRSNYHSVERSEEAKIRVLIVPGHEPDFGGTKFGDLKERDLAVELAKNLKSFLDGSNDKYLTFISRDTLSWNPIFENYFKDNWESIIAWEKSAREEFTRLVSSGEVSAPKPAVIHNIPPPDVGFRIYGITKWANENNIDLMIHIHLNDYRGRASKKAGKYSGFAVYVPVTQYANSKTTLAIAEKIFKRMKELYSVSNFKPESDGIIEDPKLIALGQNNTSNSASILIEYGYIYEPQFVNPEIRSATLKEMARQTYLGLEDFFEEK